MEKHSRKWRIYGFETKRYRISSHWKGGWGWFNGWAVPHSGILVEAIPISVKLLNVQIMIWLWIFGWLFLLITRMRRLYSIYRQNINYWYQIKVYKTIRKSVKMRQTQPFKHNMAKNNDPEVVHMWYLTFSEDSGKALDSASLSLHSNWRLWLLSEQVLYWGLIKKKSLG